jgi:hypothetical protein
MTFIRTGFVRSGGIGTPLSASSGSGAGSILAAFWIWAVLPIPLLMASDVLSAQRASIGPRLHLLYG